MTPEKKAYERMDSEEVLRILSVDKEAGLSRDEVLHRRELYGANEFTHEQKKTLLDTVFAQFKSPLVFILLLAAVATLFLREFVDAVVILIALLLNVVVGTFQEARASQAFEMLKKSQERQALVLREGKRALIPVEEVVMGDIVFLEGGSFVPADVRLVETKEMHVNESALTGEWLAVSKNTETLKGSVPLAEQKNRAWMGTLLESGYGKGVVTAVGNATELGDIAQSLASFEDTETPLQKNMQSIARFLSYAVLVALVGILLLGFLRGESWHSMILVAIAIAVATIPAGLPAAVTVVLAVGMEAILKRGGLVRNLLAAETLGATTIILTDKTGTLTEARMKLSALYSFAGIRDKAEHAVGDNAFLLELGVTQSDAYVEDLKTEADPLVVRGRPIEKALVIAGLETGLVYEILLAEYPRLDYVRFSSVRRFGASLHTNPKKKTNRLICAGEPELLVREATHLRLEGKRVKMTEHERTRFLHTLREEAQKGKRIIALSYKDVPYSTLAEDQQATGDMLAETVFAGLVAFEDPIRTDVAGAIQEVQKAGARVCMVTGDNAETAKYIAEVVGIMPNTRVTSTINATSPSPTPSYSPLQGLSTLRVPYSKFSQDASQSLPKVLEHFLTPQAGGEPKLLDEEREPLKHSNLVLEGKDIDALSDDALYEKMRTVCVLARAVPEHKLRIARLLKERGEVVAMTGDGINDAPALRMASIGVAIGSGTEVAKEASDLVLMSDSFSIIVSAIEEGRRIIDNLKKIVAYLLSTSFSEIFLMVGALVGGVPMPLVPAQILWANIVGGDLISFAFAFEKKDPHAMERSPHSAQSKNIMTRELTSLILILSIVSSVLTVVLYYVLLAYGLPLPEIRTIMFVSLSLDAFFFSLSLKALDTPLWKISFFSNPYLVGALVISVGLLLFSLTFHPLMTLLSLAHLSFLEILLLVGLGLANLVLIEGAKWVFFQKR